MGEPEDKGYTVKDKRYLHLSEEEKAKVREQAAAEGAAKQAATKGGAQEAAEEAFQEASQKAASEAGETGRDFSLPKVSFASFIFSLSSSAFVSLGAIPDPNTGKTEKNLALAKQTIDILGLLREKTRNNLTHEEENLFDQMLYDLRMSYVREVG
jgi:flagellar biosynthesis/type III secretory pathway protein FliH